jgi:hypothetical protein
LSLEHNFTAEQTVAVLIFHRVNLPTTAIRKGKRGFSKGEAPKVGRQGEKYEQREYFSCSLLLTKRKGILELSDRSF